MKRLFTAFFLMSFLVFNLLPESAYAQNRKLSVQGFLKDGNGKAVENGTYELIFKLYNVASGGTALWTETNSAVKVFGGIYTVQLGATTDISNLPWNVPYFLGVTVQGTELSPRTELTYAPYALAVNKATKADTANVSLNSICSGAVGDVKYSILDPTQFAAVNGGCWVPMDGRNIAGSKLATILGVTTIANAGGLFLRGQEFNGQAANHDPDRTSASTIATFQEQAYLSHNHAGTTNNSTTSPYSSFKYFYDVYSGDGGNLPSNTDGNSMEEGKGNPDKFMRYNTVDLSGNHSHSFTTNSNGGNETRPKNLNLWTYIRIN